MIIKIYQSRKHLNSSNVLSSTDNPAQAFNIFSIPFLYLKREFTNGACLAVKGALHKYPRVLNTLWNLSNFGMSEVFHYILSNNSVIKIRSNIKGAASNESSHTL